MDSETVYLESGWGQVRVQMVTMTRGGESRLIVGLPHLSRFAIFGRHESKSQLDRELNRAVGVMLDKKQCNITRQSNHNLNINDEDGDDELDDGCRSYFPT
jgi:hypothetical protein